MAKQRTNIPSAPQAPVRKARVLVAPSFHQAMKAYANNAVVLKALREFVTAKRQDPIAPFGAKDYPFRGSNFKGFLHAGLTFDVSVVYTLSGRDPHVIKLFGLGSHDELGTGNPPQLNKQKSMANTYKHQTSFAPLEKIDESKQQVNTPLLKELLQLL